MEGGWSGNFCFYFYKMNKKCFKCDSVKLLCLNNFPVHQRERTIPNHNDISGEGCQLQALDFCSMLSDFVYIYIHFIVPFWIFLFDILVAFTGKARFSIVMLLLCTH